MQAFFCIGSTLLENVSKSIYQRTDFRFQKNHVVIATLGNIFFQNQSRFGLLQKDASVPIQELMVNGCTGHNFVMKSFEGFARWQSDKSAI